VQEGREEWRERCREVWAEGGWIEGWRMEYGERGGTVKMRRSGRRTLGRRVGDKQRGGKRFEERGGKRGTEREGRKERDGKRGTERDGRRIDGKWDGERGMEKAGRREREGWKERDEERGGGTEKERRKERD
jgi:hypothetical protein